MKDQLHFLLNRIRERLWVKPLLMAVLSVAGALFAQKVDDTGLGRYVPDINVDSVETLLNVMSASMLLIATFAVGSMVSAYASASSTATPRTFPLVVADDVSQNALSTFVGAFIFSIVGLVAVTNGYYDKAGRFTLFALTLVVLGIVIATFVRWVDRIARLGRMGSIIDKVEGATERAIRRRCRAPTMRGVRLRPHEGEGILVYGESIGYVQRVDVPELQAYAKKAELVIVVAALPGTFAAPGRPLAEVYRDSRGGADIDCPRIARSFVTGDGRAYDEDPRFGLVVLSEIAGRALSPAVNDPGTAIDVIGTLVRLFVRWTESVEDEDKHIGECDRIEVPEISLGDMFDDAFTSIARDGAKTFEVAVRLQKAFASLASTGSEEMRQIAVRHARSSLARAEKVLEMPEHLEIVREIAARTAAGETKQRAKSDASA
jgi:uncharacterized membrane protein